MLLHPKNKVKVQYILYTQNNKGWEQRRSLCKTTPNILLTSREHWVEKRDRSDFDAEKSTGVIHDSLAQNLMLVCLWFFGPHLPGFDKCIKSFLHHSVSYRTVSPSWKQSLELHSLPTPESPPGDYSQQQPWRSRHDETVLWTRNSNLLKKKVK